MSLVRQSNAVAAHVALLRLCWCQQRSNIAHYVFIVPKRGIRYGVKTLEGY